MAEIDVIFENHTQNTIQLRKHPQFKLKLMNLTLNRWLLALNDIKNVKLCIETKLYSAKIFHKITQTKSSISIYVREYLFSIHVRNYIWLRQKYCRDSISYNFNSYIFIQHVMISWVNECVCEYIYFSYICYFISV